MKFLLPIITILIIFSGCKKNSDHDPKGNWSNSVFIVNEGPYPTGTGTICAYNRESLEVSKELFKSANSRPLGNVAQSLSVYKDKVFIVVNNANKMEVVNLEDFKSVTTIDNLDLPRYFLALNDAKGYVSCWDSTVKVIDLANYSVTASISAGTGPDEMLIAGDYLFVINGGAFGIDSTVTIINTLNDVPVKTLIVGYRPADLSLDMEGRVWVLCSGIGWNGFPAAGDKPANLVCIDPVTLEIMKNIDFPDSDNHPDHLIANKEGTTLYYNHPQGIFAFNPAGSALNTQPLVASGTMYYSIGFDNAVDMIYASDPLDFAQDGWIFRYRAQDGAAVDSFKAGIIPTGFWFNN